MRFLLGLILVPVMAGVVIALLLGLFAVVDPRTFGLFWGSPFWAGALLIELVSICVYAAPTALILLPVVDRFWPLDLRGGALLSAAGGLATVVLSLPFEPQFSGVYLGGTPLNVALLVAAFGGAGAGAAFVACRRWIEGFRRG